MRVSLKFGIRLVRQLRKCIWWWRLNERCTRIMGNCQKMAWQGEFYLIQADNESELAKTLVWEVPNVKAI